MSDTSKLLQRYRARAVECRRLAAKWSSPHLVVRYLEMAEHYERLAANLEQNGSKSVRLDDDKNELS